MERFEPFDRWVDGQLERWRGHPVPDRVFTVASELADFSLLWQLVSAARGVGSDRRADESIAFSVLLGAESLLVNQGLKRAFRRVRPTETGDPRYKVRRPVTTSFPSGHASSAFFAATVLTSLTGRRSAIAWFPLAAIVGTSRAYVRIHHASDVVGGAIVGAGLGTVAVRLLPRLARAVSRLG